MSDMHTYDHLSDDDLAKLITIAERKKRDAIISLHAVCTTDADADIIEVEIENAERVLDALRAVQLARAIERDLTRGIALVEYCPWCKQTLHSLYQHWEIIPHKASVQAAIEFAVRRKEADAYTTLRDFLFRRYNIYRCFVPDADIDLCAIALAYVTEVHRRREQIRRVRQMIRDDPPQLTPEDFA